MKIPQDLSGLKCANGSGDVREGMEQARGIIEGGRSEVVCRHPRAIPVP